MKVLQVNTNSAGGAGIACRRLHQGLLKAGVDSEMLVLNPRSISGINEHPFRDIYPGGIAGFSAKFTEYKFHRNHKRTLRKTDKYVEAFSPARTPFDLTAHPSYKSADLLHFHWVSGFVDHATFFKKNIKPVVWTLHDMNPFSGGYHYKVGFPFSDFKQEIGKQEKLKKEALSSARVHIVALTEWMKQLSERSKLLGNHPHSLIPNGIDTDTFRPYHKEFARELFQLPSSGKIFLFAAFSSKVGRKGFSLLQAALDILAAKEEKVSLAVLGNEIPAGLNPYHDYFSLGYMDDERLLALVYSAADAHIIPSVEDNLPNTVVESLCCGIPSVGFRIGGLPEMIHHGQNGFLSEAVTSDGLADLISTVNQLPLGWNAEVIRQNAVKKYDQKVQTESMIRLYKQILYTG
ncbi:MAG: glycosyltransferase [Bacteroidota bacterium]